MAADRPDNQEKKVVIVNGIEVELDLSIDNERATWNKLQKAQEDQHDRAFSEKRTAVCALVSDALHTLYSTLDEEHRMAMVDQGFVVHFNSQRVREISLHPSNRIQIKQRVSAKAKKEAEAASEEDDKASVSDGTVVTSDEAPAKEQAS